MFDVELNSIGQKTLAAPRACFLGGVLVSFCGFLLVFFFFFSQAQCCLDVLQGREMRRMECSSLL